jgi:hypothetical protein
MPVREEFIPQVIEFLADLERGNRAPVPPPKEERPPSPTQLDRDLVLRMYLESETRHRELLRALAARAGVWVFTTEVAEALGMTGGSRAMGGMFGAFGRRAKHRYDGLKPWEVGWDTLRHEAKYRMDAQVAEWIRQAIREGGA